MAIPTHHSSCYTKSYLTSCPSCNQKVWFFSCSCGSKIYFDELGAPWPNHYCVARRITDTLNLIRSSERMSENEIFELITAYEKNHKVNISDEILVIIEDVIGKRKYSFSTIDVNVSKEINDISGRVMEFNRDVNLYRKYNYEQGNIFSEALLGELGKGTYGEITVRENPDKRNISKEYKVLVKQTYYKANPLKKGDFILGTVKVVEHSKGNTFLLTGHKVY